MTPEQKKEYFKMVTELIRNQRSQVDELLSGLRIFIGNRSFWLDVSNISFWNRVKLRALAREKADKQKRILEERHINHLKSLLDQAVVAQLKNTWEEGKKRQSTNNSGVSEPAIGEKPDATPPAQKPLVIKHTGESTVVKFNGVNEAISATHDGESCLSLLLTPKQEQLWGQWLQLLNAHRKEPIKIPDAITELLHAGFTYSSLGYLDRSKPDANT